MRKNLYTFIKERLMETDIAHVDLWNEQLRFIQDEPPFAMPAAVIEFLPIRWQELAPYSYEADVALKLHILTDSRVAQWDNVIAVFDLLDAILHQLHHARSTAYGIGSMVRTASTTDHLFDEIMHNVETYECHIVQQL